MTATGFSPPNFQIDQTGDRPEESECPKCGHHGLAKRMQQISAGEIDWPAALLDLDTKHIELRGGAADEAPGAYKRLDRVIAAQGDTIRVLHRLQPIGVAMAAVDTYDPFKD